MHMGTAFADRKPYITTTKNIGEKHQNCIKSFYEIGKKVSGSLVFKDLIIKLEINSYFSILTSSGIESNLTPFETRAQKQQQ